MVVYKESISRVTDVSQMNPPVIAGLTAEIQQYNAGIERLTAKIEQVDARIEEAELRKGDYKGVDAATRERMIARLVEQKTDFERQRANFEKDKERSLKLRNGERGGTSLLNM